MKVIIKLFETRMRTRDAKLLNQGNKLKEKSILLAKFFEVYDVSMRKSLADRSMYVVCSQTWDTMGPHFWVKQCLE